MRMLLLSNMSSIIEKVIFSESKFLLLQKVVGGQGKGRKEFLEEIEVFSGVYLDVQIQDDIIDQLMGETLYQSKRKYCKISYKKRLTLIELVEEKKMGVSRAAKKLKIKIPTAKVILSTFRRKGIVFKKKTEAFKAPQSTPSAAKQETPQIISKEQEYVLNNSMTYYPIVFVYGVGFDPMINFMI